MLRNHLTIALRNIWRNKFFTFIHVLGLSIGISAALVIFLIVKYELSFDKFEADSDRIYRIVMDMKFSGDSGHSSAVPAPVSNAIETEVTGVQASIPVMTFQGDALVDVAAIRSGKPEIFKSSRMSFSPSTVIFNLFPSNGSAAHDRLRCRSHSPSCLLKVGHGNIFQA